ncbi:MAG: hypothetical protein JWP87_5969 [Labilithrix sp.]|nr:hypothetical protein [Labilithrix sp.]
MKARFLRRLVSLQGCRRAVLVAGLSAVAACTDRPPPVRVVDASDRAPREPVVETPKRIEAAAPYRTRLTFHNGELYLPTWFSAHHGGYDLVLHFHGLGKLQEGNLDRSQLNAAVVSVNLGVSTDLYGNAFRDPQSFGKLVDEAQAEIEKSGRVPGAKMKRIALSAWSAGFVSVAKILSDPANVEKVDAVLVADGFFTSLTNIKKRTVNTASLERFANLAQAASRDEKLFAITHSSIPTVDYASTTETAAKLLEMTSSTKTPSKAIGPKEMHETYAVDRGSFHVKGYEGVTAGDHIKQITGMGETMYPYLKARWEAGDGAGGGTAVRSAPAGR